MTSRTLRTTPALLAAGAVASALLVAGPATAHDADGRGGPGHGHGHGPGHGPGHGHGHGHRSAPEVIAHRGASGYRPEHTLEAYELAVAQGADAIEPDLVATRDGVLVARHENEIGGTTDVADRPEFADRRTTRLIDGTAVTGWFTEDFTYAELSTLRAEERLPEVRPGSAAYDGLYEVPTFDEVLDLADELSEETGREIRVAPETKHPTYFDSIGLDLTPLVVEVLEERDYDEADSPVVVQSFETTNLRELDELVDTPLVQLLDATGAPYDLVAAGDDTTYADLASRRGLREVARYADYVAPHKDLVLPRDEAGAIGEPSDVVRDAHRARLEVVVWTLRAENQFLPTNLRSSDDPNAHGDLAGEVSAHLDAGVDVVFSDHPDVAVAARDAWVAEHQRPHRPRR
ncbi:glycerophosphodiester phosphodiesterase [Nocardioides zeae]|uniref:glycerophosphodiester phosphodiesterase n=1 Tax=Nocardioides imazamoxiresistens TaxID=3231893 RepID=A0ABU3PUA9_9ACTN|nr:glycerophosphodiester phosphodiesterase [Nocardioides zeae]MDT9592793.1 glycerophosphodiester phosphodiesterase [Nocardioides zeae]